MSSPAIEIPSAPSRPLPIATNWVEVARGLAREFRSTVVERERKGIRPLAEVQRFRDTRLVNLLIPRKWGGEGGTLGDAARATLEVSKADGSLGFLLGFHYANSSAPRTIDLKGEGERFDRLSAKHRWFWGNVLGPFHISGEPTADGGLIAFGTKHMCTGATLGDAIKLMGKWADRDEMFVAVVPTDRKGIRSHDDWDALGLQASETHTISLDRVVVRPEEIIPSSQPLTGLAGFANYGLYSAAFHLGTILGALEETRDYLAKLAPGPRMTGAGPSLPNEDAFVQLEYGKAWSRLQAVQALFDQQIRESESAWERRGKITPKEQGELLRRGTALQIEAADLALHFTAKLFELTGGRSTGKRHGLDRFWRDVRVYSVHHPVSYVTKGLGAAALGVTVKAPTVFEARKEYEERRGATAFPTS